MEIAGYELGLYVKQPLQIINGVTKRLKGFQGRQIAQVLAEQDLILSLIHI